MDLGSDQTSCHDPFGGGYYPVQLGFQESNKANKILEYTYIFLISYLTKRHNNVRKLAKKNSTINHRR